MYYARSADIISELSKQDASLFTSNAATWFVQFYPDGTNASAVGDCVLQKSTPGGAGNSKNGFVLYHQNPNVAVHLKPNTESPAVAFLSIGTTANKTVAACFSFNTSKFRVSANGSASSEVTTPAAFTVANTNPLVLGHYWDVYWGSLKGWVMRIATWQDYVASASEMNTLTAAFADPCYAPLPGPANAIMFSCNT
jgi:hypothetical protein